MYVSVLLFDLYGGFRDARPIQILDPWGFDHKLATTTPV